MPQALGTAPCPLCGEEAEVKENRSSKAYVSCEWCSSQIQTRTKHGDRHIRRLITEPTEPANDSKPTDEDVGNATEERHDDRAEHAEPEAGRGGRRRRRFGRV